MAEEVKPIKTERIDNPDGTYTVKEVYKEPNFANGLSNIKVFDALDNELHCEWYKNKNFTQLLYQHDCKNYTENTCDIYAVYTELQDNNWYSAIAKMDYINNRQLNVKYYKDKNFTDLCWKILKEYKTEEKCYIKTSILTVPFGGWLSRIEKFSMDNKFLSGKFYIDDNFINMGANEYREYDVEGNATSYIEFQTIQDNGFISAIEKFDKYSKRVSGQYFKEQNFKNLILNIKYKYNSDGSFMKYFVFEEPNKNGELSSIEYFNKNVTFKSRDSFLDQKFKQKIETFKIIHHNDGSYTEKTKSYNISIHIYSINIEKYDKYGNLIYKKQYKFKGILAHILFWLAR